MKKQKLKISARIFLILWSVLLIGACSSDDNSIQEEEGLLHGDSSFTMKMDGVSWHADEVYITTAGGPEWWEEDEERLYFVTITAIKYLDGDKDPENIENFGITMIVPEEKFTNPKHNYLAPPPENLDVPGYSWGVFTSIEDYINYMSVDPEEANRNVGYIDITGFEIGNQIILGEGYVSLSGTFEYELYGFDFDNNTFLKKKATEGRFEVSNIFF